MIDFSVCRLLSFDCYGTLIDWEQGILDALRPVLATHGHVLDAAEMLEAYARVETALEAGSYRPYREILLEVADRLFAQWRLPVSQSERACIFESLPLWRPFPDVVPALRLLGEGFGLAILSNIDRDLFAASAAHLQVSFDFVITAQDVGSYKPALAHFEELFRVTGLPADAIIHVAQSKFHDVVPARQLGMRTIWINRRRGQEGWGATPMAEVEPDLELPDLTSLVNVVST